MDDANLLPLTETLLHSAPLGLSVLVLVLLFTSGVIVRIAKNFNKHSNKLGPRAIFWIEFRFVLAILQICVIQILAIVIWTLAVYLPGLSQTLTQAFLFVGSCYTTLGIFSDILPPIWKSLAFYIAFSGLFSFALTTSVVISMIMLMVNAKGPVAKPEGMGRKTQENA